MSFRSKMRGYKAAFRVEEHRAAAESLRESDPETYQQIISQAEGEAAEAARKDPDAFVAIFLSYAEEEGVFTRDDQEQSEPQESLEAAPTCTGSERKPHPPTRTVPVEDPEDLAYRCPTCGREQRIDLSTRLNEDNIEDWDFTHCDLDDPEYDAEADLFLSTHYSYVIGMEALRSEEIDVLVRAGIAVPSDDGKHVELAVSGDDFLAGYKSGSSRFSREGRLRRKVVESLRREYRRDGRIRIELGALARISPRGHSGEDEFVAAALDLRRTDPDHFEELRHTMNSDLMRRMTGFEGEDKLREQGWSEEDAAVAAVAAFLREADAQGLERM